MQYEYLMLRFVSRTENSPCQHIKSTLLLAQSWEPLGTCDSEDERSALIEWRRRAPTRHGASGGYFEVTTRYSAYSKVFIALFGRPPWTYGMRRVCSARLPG